jgi:hypothetical protein
MTRKKIEAVLAAKLEAERAGAQGGGDVAGAVRELVSLPSYCRCRVTVVAELLSLPSYCRCRVTVVAELLSLPNYCRCRVTVTHLLNFPTHFGKRRLHALHVLDYLLLTTLDNFGLAECWEVRHSSDFYLQSRKGCRDVFKIRHQRLCHFSPC